MERTPKFKGKKKFKKRENSNIKWTKDMTNYISIFRS